jgi:hypothetical protein
MTPGRIPSSNTSAASTSLSSASTAAGFFRSSPTERLPRVSSSCCGEVERGPGLSMRNTSAPRSASIMAQNGPGPMLASSITRRPVSGPDLLTVG